MPIPSSPPGRYHPEITTRRPITGAATAITAFVGCTRTGPTDQPVAINSFRAFENQFGGLSLDSPLSFAVQDYFANGGRHAIVVRLHEPESDGAATAADFLPPRGSDAQTGLYALDKADAFNLLCIAPHVLGGSIEPALIDVAISYCTARGAMMIVDPPAEWRSASDAIAGIDRDVGSARANAALYFPRIVRPNPLRGNRAEIFAPCGAVAGVIARIDGERGVWQAPAGMEATLKGISKTAVALSDADQGLLNQRGINCLRPFPGKPAVVWGARTRHGADSLADDWKYIPVRRTALLITQSLREGLTWVVFEPNDEPLWASIRSEISAFMQGLFRQGAFQGQSASEAWFVQCGHNTTTPADVASGIINVVIGFAPLKPAEFVIVTMSLTVAPAA
jgi:uncharacterized protein